MAKKPLTQEELTQEVERLTTENETLRQENTELKGIVSDLSKENRQLAETKGNPNPLVTLADGRKVQLNHGITYKGHVYSVQQLAGRPDLVEILLANNSTAATLIH